MRIDKISARHVFEGKAVDARKGTAAARVKVDIGGGHVVISSITAGSVDNLGLAPGSGVVMIIKAPSVMLGLPG